MMAPRDRDNLMIKINHSKLIYRFTCHRPEAFKTQQIVEMAKMIGQALKVSAAGSRRNMPLEFLSRKLSNYMGMGKTTALPHN